MRRRPRGSPGGFAMRSLICSLSRGGSRGGGARFKGNVSTRCGLECPSPSLRLRQPRNKRCRRGRHLGLKARGYFSHGGRRDWRPARVGEKTEEWLSRCLRLEPGQPGSSSTTTRCTDFSRHHLSLSMAQLRPETSPADIRHTRPGLIGWSSERSCNSSRIRLAAALWPPMSSIGRRRFEVEEL